jgi:hypothetical protein
LEDLRDDDFKFLEAAQQAAVLGQGLGNLSPEQVRNVVGAEKQFKFTKADLDLAAEELAASENLNPLDSFFQLFDPAAKRRRKVLRKRQGLPTSGEADRTFGEEQKGKLKEFSSEAEIRKANPPSGRVRVGGKEFIWEQE